MNSFQPNSFSKLPITLFLLIFSLNLFQVNSQEIILSTTDYLDSLISSNKLDQVCSRSPNDLSTLYKKTKDSYTSEFTKKINSPKAYVRYIKKNENTNFELFTEYLKSTPSIIFVLVISICFLIGWFVAILCRRNSEERFHGIMEKFFCCVKEDDKEDILKNVFTFVSLGCLILTVVFSIISLFYSITFSKEVNGISCSSLKFNDELLNSESISKVNKWHGIDNLVSILNQTINSLDNISSISNQVTIDENQITTEINNFNKKLNEFYDEYAGVYYTPQYFTDKLNKIVPLYIENFGPTNKEDSYLNSISKEISTKMTTELGFINKTIGINKKLDSQSENLKENLALSIDNLNTISASFNKIYNNVITKVVNIEEKTSKYLRKLFKSLFIMNIVIASIGIIISIPYSTMYRLYGKIEDLFKKLNCDIKFTQIKKAFKIILIVLYNFYALFGILTFISSMVFLYYTKLTTDSIGLFQEIFSYENLITPKKNISFMFEDYGNVTKYFDTCLNQEGHLYEDFYLDNSTSAYYLTDLYMSRDEAYILKNNLNILIDKMYQVSILKKDLIYYSKNIDETNKEIAYLLTQVENFTNKNSENYMGNNDNTFKHPREDKWVFNKINCGYEYIYTKLTLENIDEDTGKTCLSFYDYNCTEEDELCLSFYLRYDDRIFDSQQTTFESFRKFIYEFSEYIYFNDKYINKLLNTSNIMNSNYKDIIKITNSSIVECIDSINCVTDIYNDDVIDMEQLDENEVKVGGIFSILNCKFMQKNLNIYYDQVYNNFRKNSNAFSWIIFTSGLFEGLSCFFVVVVINMNREISKEEVYQRHERHMKEQENKDSTNKNGSINEKNNDNDNEIDNRNQKKRAERQKTDISDKESNNGKNNGNDIHID